MKMDVSLLRPFVPMDPIETHPVTQLVAEDLFSRLWLGQSWTLDPTAICAHLAGADIRVPIGIGVSVTTARHPIQGALEARTVTAVTGHVPHVAFGPGSLALQNALLGSALRRPVTETSRFLAEVRNELGSPTRSGESPSPPVRLPPSVAPMPRLGMGVLRTAMAEAAGRCADSAVLWMTPTAYIEHTIIPALDRGSGRAGVSRPSVVAMIPTVPDSARVNPINATDSTVGGHIKLAHYRDMLCRAGLVMSGDRHADAITLMSGGAVLHGDQAEFAAGMRRFERAGVDDLVINLTGVHHLAGPSAVGSAVDEVLAAAQLAGVGPHGSWSKERKDR